MDSISNLSLLEIAGEDDSLLLEVPAAATSVFSCSPLLSLRSLPRTECRAGAADSANPSSSQKDSANKENVNWSKQEVATPKLSVEPQKMKRKKKGGGYNLRKSLAWDRAFFTEEGVLNPTELSMINGTATPKRTNAGLNVIHEEEPSSASLALQEIEENLFKQSSDGICNEQRNTCAGSTPKSGASTKDRARAPLAKRKVPALNDVVGNRSKRNVCPRPVASSSLKRPETAKAPSKESKVTRIPGPKYNVTVSTTTARSGMLSTVSSKRIQNANPVINVQKHAGAKGMSKNPRTVPSNPKVPVADKCSVTKTLNKQAGKRLDNSISETHPPSRLHQPGTGADKVPEACLPQGVSDTGRKKQQTQFHTTKPSGLRMPSPSLAFFSQAKPSSSDNQLQKSSKPCNPAESNISKLKKLETNSVNEARRPHAPRKRCEIVEDTAKDCSDKLSLSDVKSELSMQVHNMQMAGAEVECDSVGFEKISKQEMVDNTHKAGIALECDSLGFEKISKQEMFENMIEHVNIKSKEQTELHDGDNVSDMEGMEFPGPEKKLLSENYAHEQLEKETVHPSEDKLYDVFSNGNQTVFQEPQSMHHHSMHRTLIGKDNISNTLLNAMGEDKKQIKLLTSDVLTSNESSVLQEKDGTLSKDSRLSGEFKENNCVKTALVNYSLSSFSETVLGGSTQEFPYKNAEQVSDTAGDFGKHEENAQVHLMNENLSGNCNDSTQSVSEAVNQQLQGGEIKTPNPSFVGEISSKNENESHGNSCKLVHVTTLSSKGSPEMSIPEIDTTCDCEPKMDEVEDCHCRKPVDEGYDQVIESKAAHDRTQAFELDKMCDDCITVSATACSTEVNNFSSESQPYYEDNIENLHSTSQLCPMVKADCDSIENDMPINDQRAISELKLGDNGSSRDTSMHCDVQCDVPGKFEQQASTLTYSETNEMLCEDENLVGNHHHLLDDSEFSEVRANFNSTTEDSICGGAENPSALLQDTLLAQSVREFDHINRENEESHLEDENPVVYNCNNEHCVSVTNDQFPLAGDNNINEESHIYELQRPNLVGGEDSQHVNNLLHLDGNVLPTNTACSEEVKRKKLFEGALEGCNISISECNASNHHTQLTSEYEDGNLDLDERTEPLQIGDSKKGSTDILPSVEVQLNHEVISDEFDYSIKVSEDRITEVVDRKPDGSCSLTDNSELAASDNSTFHMIIPPDSEGSSLNSNFFSEEAATSIFEKDEFPITDMQHQTKVGFNFAEDSSKTTHLKFATKSNPEVLTVKPPPNAVPFSDEWLAAVEAAGEEILTMKSGAVQNSPPEKPQHEPGPWSPVKRKNQAIGPFDCTKHTNISHSSS